MTNKSKPWFGAARRLVERGADSYGLAVDESGVTLGPDFQLVRRTSRGYEPATLEELSCLQKVATLRAGDVQRLARHLESIAKALRNGDIAKARLLGLYFPINQLTPGQLDRLRKASTLLKQNFNFDEPRDDRGRWTTGGANTVPSRVVVPIGEGRRTRGSAVPDPNPMRVQEFLPIDPEILDPLIDGEPIPQVEPAPSIEGELNPLAKPRPRVEEEPKPPMEGDVGDPSGPFGRRWRPVTYSRCKDSAEHSAIWRQMCEDLRDDPEFAFHPSIKEFLLLCQRGMNESVEWRRGLCSYIFEQ